MTKSNTSENGNGITRRAMIASAGIGAACLTGLTGEAMAAARELTATEKVNLNVVNEFMTLFGKPEATPEKLTSFFTDDCVLRLIEGQPPTVGRADAIKLFGFFLKDGQRIGIETYESFVRGPVVSNNRLDWVIGPDGKRGAEFDVAGIFILRDQKIHEWIDFVVKN